jgi:ethanolaminephosphotransferase
LFASPKFRTIPTRKEYECSTLPQEGTPYTFYNQVEQQDLVPTLSGLMGLPIPRNSIGKVVGELRGVWQDDASYVDLLEQNAQQLWTLVDAVLEHEVPRNENTTHLSCVDNIKTVDRLACLLKFAEQQTERSRETEQWDDARVAYEEFSIQAQQALIDGNHSFNILHMAAGIATCALALVVCLYSIGASWPSGTATIIFASTAACYGITLFGSTSERSEHSF